jgi:hypothetical protein
VKADPYDNKRNETMYFYTDTDSDTQLRQLDGASSYTVTFPKGQLPPVKGFWSLTMYNPEHFFYPNALGTKNKSLKYDADGGLTINLGNKSPGKEKEANWLPAPEGNFSIWLRAYCHGTWKPPVVLRRPPEGAVYACCAWIRSCFIMSSWPSARGPRKVRDASAPFNPTNIQK